MPRSARQQLHTTSPSQRLDRHSPANDLPMHSGLSSSSAVVDTRQVLTCVVIRDITDYR